MSKLGLTATLKNFKQCIDEILKHDTIACDTETTGLQAFLNDRLFSIIISTEEKSYYFNFNTEDAIFISKYCKLIPKKTGEGYLKKTKIFREKTLIPIDKKFILPYEWCKFFNRIFKDPKRTVFFHSAKFDMHFLAKEGIEFKCICFCTENGSRLNRNDLPTYTLSYISKMIGEYKSDAVTKYIKDHQLANKETGAKHYEHVLFSVIAEYGLRDGHVTYKLGKYTRARIIEKDIEAAKISDLRLDTVLQNELKLTHTLYDMEKTGFRCGQKYTKEAFDYAVNKYESYASEFGAMTGLEFSDGELTLKPAFEGLALAWGVTASGKPSFADGVLSALDHPLAEIIQGHRKWYKFAHTYFENFLNLSDVNGDVHCNFRQGGTKHGRLSCANPNLQNVPKERKDKDGNFISKFPVRRCFKPREGFFYLMPDFDQMEYRLMLDYANEQGVIKMVLDGVDIHTATKEQMGVKDTADMSARDIAKRINFLLLYGGGCAKLALNLYKVPIEEDLLKNIWPMIWKEQLNEYEIAARCNIENDVAKLAYNTLNETHELRQLYFTKLPNVKKFIKQVQKAAENRGFIFNWFGRRCYFSKGFEYTAPNHLISGGCADIVKLAMNQIFELLKPYQSRMLLQVHDEIVFEIKIGEEEIIPKIKRIMEKVYPHQYVPLTVGVDYSTESWADKKEWVA